MRPTVHINLEAGKCSNDKTLHSTIESIIVYDFLRDIDVTIVGTDLRLNPRIYMCIYIGS